jgi:hypothetical protein
MNPLQQNKSFCFLFAQLGWKLVPGKSEEARISHFEVLWSSLKLLKFPKPPRYRKPRSAYGEVLSMLHSRGCLFYLHH